MSTITVQTSSRRLLSKKLILILKHFRIQLRIRRHIKRKFTEISRSRNFVSRKCSFSRKYWYSKHFRENVNENFRSRNKFYFTKIWYFCKKYIFQIYSCLGSLFQVTYKPTSPRRPVLIRLSCPGCHPVPAALPGPRLSSRSCPAQATLATAFLTPLSYLGSPVISVLSILTCPGCQLG
jgi:hypothetical protein